MSLIDRFRTACIAALLSVNAAAAQASEVSVVASIKPVQSLAAAIMRGAGAPMTLVDGAASPHAYALKPSQALALAEADLVIWVGPDLETFLDKRLTTLAPRARVLTLSKLPGLDTLGLREGGAFEVDDHDDEHGAEDGGDGEEIDIHLWLDPVNAKTMARAIAASLIAIDPEQTTLYQANLGQLERDLDAMVGEVTMLLAPVKGRAFIVFHDAFQYFETRFAVTASGSIAVNPEVAPGARRVRAIQDRLADGKIVCVFSEPQFKPRLVSAIIDGTGVRHGELDPLGADLPAGPTLYPMLIRQLAASLTSCLMANG